jgi:CubicO group peptidase (beta-lactamase class C family)
MRRSFVWMVALGAACRIPIQFDTPIPVDDTFVRALHDTPAWQAAADYSAIRGGYAFMVLRGDEVIVEAYSNGDIGEEPHHLWSGTKSFSCALAALAERDGLLTLDSQARTWISEWASDPRGDITVRELLQFTSGLPDAKRKLTWDGAAEPQFIADKYMWAVNNLKPVAAPGERFIYGSQHLSVFGEVLERAGTGDVLEYLEAGVLDPIGFRYAGWIRDPSDNPMLPYGAFTTANEWAKYGVLLRDDGVWRGEQLVPPGSLSRCREGSSANPAYGLSMWRNAVGPTDDLLGAFPSLEHETGVPVIRAEGPDDLFMAAGYNDNRMYILPSRDVIVVRLGNSNDLWVDAEQLDLVLAALDAEETPTAPLEPAAP